MAKSWHLVRHISLIFKTIVLLWSDSWLPQKSICLRRGAKLASLTLVNCIGFSRFLFFSERLLDSWLLWLPWKTFLWGSWRGYSHSGEMQRVFSRFISFFCLSDSWNLWLLWLPWENTSLRQLERPQSLLAWWTPWPPRDLLSVTEPIERERETVGVDLSLMHISLDHRGHLAGDSDHRGHLVITTSWLLTPWSYSLKKIYPSDIISFCGSEKKTQILEQDWSIWKDLLQIISSITRITIITVLSNYSKCIPTSGI